MSSTPIPKLDIEVEVEEFQQDIKSFFIKQECVDEEENGIEDNFMIKNPEQIKNEFKIQTYEQDGNDFIVSLSASDSRESNISSSVKTIKPSNNVSTMKHIPNIIKRKIIPVINPNSTLETYNCKRIDDKTSKFKENDTEMYNHGETDSFLEMPDYHKIDISNDCVIKLESTDSDSDSEMQMVIDEEELEFSKLTNEINELAQEDISKVSSNEYEEAVETPFYLKPETEKAKADNKNVSLYKCDPCEKNFSNMTNFALHVTEEHKDDNLMMTTEDFGSTCQLIAKRPVFNDSVTPNTVQKITKGRKPMPVKYDSVSAPVKSNKKSDNYVDSSKQTASKKIRKYPNKKDKLKLICSSCKAQFQDEETFKHHQSKVQTCILCVALHQNIQAYIPNKYKTCQEYEKHLKGAHKLTYLKAACYPTCTHCSKRLSSAEEFIRHCIRCTQDSFMQHSCNICNAIFTTEEDLYAHFILEHTVRSDCDMPVTLTQCPYCKAMLPACRNNPHCCPNLPQDRVRCKYCDFKCQNNLLLRVHQKAMEGKSVCEQCNEKLPKKCAKDTHTCKQTLQANGIVETFMCTLCSKTYNYKKHLFEHLHLEHFTFLKVKKKGLNSYVKTILLGTRKSNSTVTDEIPLSSDSNNTADVPTTSKNFLSKVTSKKINLLDIRNKISSKMKNISKETNADVENVVTNTIVSSNVFVASNSKENLDIDFENMIDIKTEVKAESIDDEDDIILLSSDIDNAFNNFDYSVSHNDETNDAPDLEVGDKIYHIENEIIFLKRNPKKPRRLRLYECNECGIKMSKKSLATHIKENNCSSFDKKAKLIKFKSGSLFKNNQCQFCYYKHDDINKYLKHWGNHGIEQKQCPDCFATFKNFSKLSVHIQRHVHNNYTKLYYLNKDVAANKYYHKHARVCKICKEQIPKPDVFRHWEEHMNDSLCELNMEKPKDIKIEAIADGDLTMTDMLINNLLNPDANLKKNNIKSDGETYDDKRNKECVACAKKFNRISEIKRHLIEHLVKDAIMKSDTAGTNDQILNCHICSLGFNRELDLKSHLRDHAGMASYQCHLCDKTFSDSSNFAKHKKVHGLSCLHCDLCGRKFNTKRMMEQHMAYHKVKKPKPCEFCGKVFYFDSSYHKHVKFVHKKLSRYLCKVCNKSFGSLKEKWDHCWEEHGDRNVYADCPKCPEKFRKLTDIKRHMKAVHNCGEKFISGKVVEEKKKSQKVD